MEQAAPFVTAVETIRKPEHGVEGDAMGAAFASMMEACVEGTGPRFSRTGTGQARIEWTDARGEKRAFTMDATEGCWNVDNPPENGREVPDGWGMAEKMLDAVLAGWPIRAFRTEDGLGVISWDRQSKGNHPAVVMQPVSGTIVVYYEAPAEFRTAADD